MVGPHTGEFHVVAVVGLEESLLQRFVQAGLAVIPIPVPQQYVDTAALTKPVVNLPRRGQALVQFAQQGCTGLLMSFEPRACASDEVVFGPSGGVNFVMKRRGVVVGEYIGRNFHSFGLLEQCRVPHEGFKVVGKPVDRSLFLIFFGFSPCNANEQCQKQEIAKFEKCFFHSDRINRFGYYRVKCPPAV